MKIVILTVRRNHQNYENVRFMRAARSMGISLLLLDPSECEVRLSGGCQSVYYLGKELVDIDYVLVRLGCMISSYDSLIISVLSDCGFKCSALGDKVSLMANKMQLSQVLVGLGVRVIDSVMVGANHAVRSPFGFPCVFKSNVGSLGLGIYLVNNQMELDNLVNQSRLLDRGYSFLIQRFVDHKRGEDIRVFMYRDKVIGAMRRFSDGVDFRANYSVHCNAKKFVVNDVVLDICQRVMARLDVDIAGIDILEVSDGYVVCEVNSAPGFKGLEACNLGLDVSKVLFKMIGVR